MGLVWAVFGKSFIGLPVKLIDWQTIKVLRTFENGAEFQGKLVKRGSIFIINFRLYPTWFEL